MTTIPKITKSDVKNWTNSAYFQRGENYYRGGAIYNQRREEMTIKSQCAGSYQDFYRQEVQFSNKGIESADCSCPVGDGGYCKHVVALLLTWVHDMASFVELEMLDSTLEKRSKAELIVLIKEMLDQNPELSYLLELPLIAKSDQPLDLGAIRRQAEQAFQNHDYEWGYAREIKKSLRVLLNIASVHLASGQTEDAASVYMIIIETILDRENDAMSDEDGSLLGLIYDCSEALGNCLALISDEIRRRDILQVLFSAYRWDVLSAGGVGAADCVPDILVRQTTSVERSEISAWVREIMPKGDDWSDGYRREVLGRLLLDLEADILDDEAYLRICRETGRLNDLIDRLIQLKRVDDAKAAARKAKDYELLLSLKIFENQGMVIVAEKLVVERLTKIEDSRLLEWLSKRYAENSNLAGALALEERLFWMHPRVEKYEKLSELAEKIDCWEPLREKTLSLLENEGKFYLLVGIYLFEKEAGSALSILDKAKPHWRGDNLRFKVARLAKANFPHDAIRILTEDAESFTERRGRDNYAEAAKYLFEVRDTYKKMGDMQEWKSLISKFRGRYKKLPALQDELNKLKL